MKTDFVLTTLAMRKQSHFFHSISQQKHPCSTFAFSFLLERKHRFSNMAIVCIVWQKLAKKRKTKTIFDLQKHCLNEKPKAGYPTVAKPKRLNKNKCMFFFHVCLFFTFCSLCLQLCSILFISFHLLFSVLIYFHVVHFFSFPAFFFSWKTITNPDHLHVDPLLTSAEI